MTSHSLTSNYTVKAAAVQIVKILTIFHASVSPALTWKILCIETAYWLSYGAKSSGSLNYGTPCILSLARCRLTSLLRWHVVRCRHFRSRDKDGGYTIRWAVPENPMLHAKITALCLIERELLPIEVLHCGNRNFRPFGSRDLDNWHWPYDLHIRTRTVLPGDILHVQIWTSYVETFESYRLTDIRTHRRDQNYIPRRFAGGQKKKYNDNNQS